MGAPCPIAGLIGVVCVCNAKLFSNSHPNLVCKLWDLLSEPDCIVATNTCPCMCVVIREVMVKVHAHAACICCFICKLVSRLIAVYAYTSVSSSVCAHCMSSCPMASSNDLWQSSTGMPISCIEHFECIAMLSVTSGLQCLRAI